MAFEGAACNLATKKTSLCQEAPPKPELKAAFSHAASLFPHWFACRKGADAHQYMCVHARVCAQWTAALFKTLFRPVHCSKCQHLETTLDPEGN